MYIPSQTERYSKVANYTLLLCLVIPSIVVDLVYSDVMGIMDVLGACVWPIAWPLTFLTGSKGFSLFVGSVVLLAVFLWLRRSSKPAKQRLTIAIVLGMLLALALRLIFVLELSEAVIRHGLNN